MFDMLTEVFDHLVLEIILNYHQCMENLPLEILDP
jgi:hypothetical protein